MFTQLANYSCVAANDDKRSRDRTVPIPSSIVAVAGYPSKLVVYKIAASKYWHVRCWVDGRFHKRSAKTTSFKLAERFARWFYESLLAQRYARQIESSAVTTKNSTRKTTVPQELTFSAIAAQVYANEQARMERGEFGAGSLRMLRNRLDAYVLPHFGSMLPSVITYQMLQEFAQTLSIKHSTTTVSHYLIVVRKVLVHAVRIDALEHLPDIPKIKVKSASRGAFTPTEYWQLLRAARGLRGVQHPASRKAMRKRIKQAYNDHKMPPDMAWAISMMVNCFLRPGDLTKLKHRHVEVIRGKNTYLRLTLPETKLHSAPIVTLRPAVRIYEQICKHRLNAKPNDYLLLPDLKNRTYALAVLITMFNWVLDHTGLKLNPHGNPRSLYSLRHSAITFRLLYGQGIDLVTLARNARTSVEVINNHYASTVTGEQNIAMLQSRRTQS
jgi:integrase